MAFNKIGFLGSGSGGNPSGIGDYVRRLDDAGIPAVVMCNDGTVGLSDVFSRWQAGSTVPHVCAFRVVKDDRETYAVPDYNATPRDAAVQHWQLIRPFIPPEVTAHKDRVWIFPINEVDKNRSDWLGNFSVEIAKLMNAEGYKCASFGWSSGEPEPAHWETSGMLQYLSYCAQHPQLAAVNLHEYSYTVDDIWDGYDGSDYWKVGRLTHLHAVCDRRNVPRPTILIGEWGWTLNDVPGTQTAMAHIRDVAAFYAQFPNVIGAGLWYLGPYQNIADKAQRLIKPVTDFTLGTVFPDPQPPTPPPPDDCPGQAREPYERVYWVVPGHLPIERRRALYAQAAEEARTVGPSYDDAGIGAGLTAKTAVLWDIPTAERAAFRDWYAEHYPDVTLEFPGDDPDPEPPPEPPAFAFTAWPTASMKLNQWFAANRDDYDQFGLPGHDGTDHFAPHGASIYAAADGVVSRVHTNGSSHNYGIHVRVDHADSYQTIYAHLERPLVAEGQRVVAGERIGLADNTGNSRGDHLHFGLKRIGYTYRYEEADGSVTAWPYNLFDPWPFLRPLYDAWLDDNGVSGYVWAASVDENREGDYGRAAGNLNMRSGPNSGHEKIGRVTAGSIVKILGPAEGSGYYPVIAPVEGDTEPGPAPPPGYTYRGPAVTFRPHLHAPADDWAWQLPGVRTCFDQTGLKAKFMTSGMNADYFYGYGDAGCLTRIFWKPWPAQPQQFWSEVRGDVRRMVSRGARKFEIHNEPNLPQEGLGVTWADGVQFGAWLSQVIDLIRAEFPDVQLYFPGMSPGGPHGGSWTNQFDFIEAAWPQVAAKMDGFCMHAYTVGSTLHLAHDELVTQVRELQRHLQLQVPLFVSESSHKDAGTPYNFALKAQVYRAVETTLATLPGVEGIAWYVASWKNPPPDHVYKSEIWEGTPLPSLYAAA